MKKYHHKTLNVSRLLAMRVLDIRGVAARNRRITADAYFAKVERFIEEAPQSREILNYFFELAKKAKELEALEVKLGVEARPLDLAKDTEVLKKLEEIKNNLSEIGYDGLSSDLDAICTAIKSADLKWAEALAANALNRFDTLVDKLKSVCSVKKFAGVQTRGGVFEESDFAISLVEALNYFDYLEENRKLRILAVDDVAVVLNTLMSVLSPHYEVFALKDSTKVERFLAHTTPELFLLDIEMNEVNGFDLVPLIRRFEEHRDTPIIFLTGNASYSNLKDAVALGACDFITKPINPEVLLEKIGKNILRKRAY